MPTPDDKPSSHRMARFFVRGLTVGGVLSLVLAVFLFWFTSGSGEQGMFALGRSLPPLLVGIGALAWAHRMRVAARRHS
jgi:hypothetical protein